MRVCEYNGGMPNVIEAPAHPRSPVPRAVVIAAAVVILVIVGAYLYVAYRMTTTVLDGPAIHDFGTILLEPGESRTLEADIDMVNRSGSTRVLERIRSSCSCLRVDAPLGPIEPGETLTVQVKLIVEEKGRAGGAVLMGFDGLGAQQVTVGVVARSTQTLSVSPSTVVASEEGKATVTFVARRYDEAQPSEPYWTSPATELSDATFLGWSRLSDFDASAGTPAVWQGEFAVSAKPAPGQVVPMMVHLGQEQSATVQILHQSMRPSSPGDRRLPLDALQPPGEDGEASGDDRNGDQ